MHRPMSLVVIALVATTANLAVAADAGRNQSCQSVPCRGDVAVRLYCSTATEAPYRGPAKGGTCKECAGSTVDKVRCATTATTAPPTTTTSSTTSTTRPGAGSSTSTTSSTAPPPTTTSTTLQVSVYPGRTGPYRPNDCDLSIAWDNDTYALQYCDHCGLAHTCSQYERRVKEETLIKRATDVADLFENDCTDATRYAYGPSGLDAIAPRLNWPYKARDLMKQGGGQWIVGAKGHVYSIHRTILKKYRACLVDRKMQAKCRLWLAADTATRKLLNINAACDGGPNPDVVFNTPIVVKARESLAPLDSRPATIGKHKADVARDVRFLDALDDAHAHTVCNSTAGMIDVQTAMLNYEAACCAGKPVCDEVCMGFRFLQPFKGGCDPSYDVGTCCAWKDATHVRFAKWVAAQKAGLAGESEENSSDHREDHNCMNNGSPLIETIRSCSEARQQTPNCKYGTAKRGKRSCREFLDIFIAEREAGRIMVGRDAGLGELEGGG